MVNLVISSLRLLCRVLSRLVVWLTPRKFSRMAQAELRSLESALSGFVFRDPRMNWMRRGRPGLHPATQPLRIDRYR
jgi:hypothetical protein